MNPRVDRAEAHRDLMEMLYLVPAWEADRFRDALSRFEEAVRDEYRPTLTAVDRALADMTVREGRIRSLANGWMSEVLNEDRDYTVSAEQAAALGYYLTMALDHPEELEGLKLVVSAYGPKGVVDEGCAVRAPSGRCSWEVQGFRSCEELSRPCREEER